TPMVFSAGTDLASARDGSPRTGRGGEYGVIRRDREKPLIAAVEGPARGGGFEIVLSCDPVVAARPGCGATQWKARSTMLSGEPGYGAPSSALVRAITATFSFGLK